MNNKPNTANEGSRSRNSSTSNSHKTRDNISVKGNHDYIHIVGDPKSDYGSSSFVCPEIAKVMSRFDRYERNKSMRVGKLYKGSNEHIPKDPKDPSQVIIRPNKSIVNDKSL